MQYPTILIPLPSDKLKILQKEFDELNNYTICINLNHFGFTGEDDIYKYHPNPKIILTEQEAMNIAIASLTKNKKFTNVSDSLGLLSNISNIHPLGNDSTAWEINIGNQKYNGYEVQSSWIVVRLYGDGVYQIFGFWYKNINSVRLLVK